jgi:hypothetical protein
VYTKCTMVFKLTTNNSNPNTPIKRQAGWTEGWYNGATDIRLVREQFSALCQARALLLPSSALITGQRYQQVDPVGPSGSTSNAFPGNSQFITDVPQMALLCRVPAAAAKNVRPETLRGLPDAVVVEGEYTNPSIFGGFLDRYHRQVNNFFFRGQDLSLPAFPIWEIDNTGNITFEEIVNFPVGSVVHVLRSEDTCGRLRGQRAMVKTVNAPNSVTVAPWPWGVTTGGSCRLESFLFLLANGSGASVTGVGVRKVGRPTTPYRGRRSKRPKAM